MFATALVVEREPITLADMPTLASHWLQIVGGMAMFWTIVWMVFRLPMMRRVDRERIPTWQSRLFIASLLLAAVFYGIGITMAVAAATTKTGTVAPEGNLRWRNTCLTLAGAFALLPALLPILRNLFALRFRRIWALARLSFQEAVRNRVLYALALPLLYFLFAPWFSHAKPEAQLSTYVGNVFWLMTITILFIATVISAFSIPSDLSRQTIHTIVTKPVERFEIVLGRFLGFTMLMTLVLFALSTVALIHVVRGVDPDAAAESLKAREALYGNLSFEGTSDPDKKRGDSVGREWEYRSYIAAEQPGHPPQYAIWSFPTVPSALSTRTTVPCEFTFDIYRTTKGDENVGINCAFVFTSWRFKKGDEVPFQNERTKERNKSEGRLSDAEIDSLLAEKYGIYEVPSFKVNDFHTMTLEVPGGLFKHAAQSDPALEAERKRRNESVAPIQVRVKCTSYTQYIGMAKYDLYFRADDPDSGHDRLWFAWNFYKAGFGLWLRLCLVTALAVVMSTYLSGVVAFIITWNWYGLGIFVAFIQEVMSGKNVGGGPLEAALRLGRRDNLAVPLEETTTNMLATKFDSYYRFALGRVLNVIPDVYSSNLVGNVQAGFNIAPEQLLVALILMVGYLLPWFLAGYYLLNWREIASSN